MRQIKKGTEPRELLEYRKSGDINRSYRDFGHKPALRDALLRDQQFLCCYCMRRIDVADMKIEHYRSQTGHGGLELDWKNLLGACDGREGRPLREQTCDTRKGDLDVTVDPRGPVERSVRYTVDGRLKSDDAQIQLDLDEHLNLNLETLQQWRRDKLAALPKALELKLGRSKSWTRAQLEAELAAIEASTKAEPLVGIVEWWLRRQIRRRP